MYVFSEVISIIFNWREVPDPVCPCFRGPGIRDTIEHQLHFLYLLQIFLRRFRLTFPLALKDRNGSHHR